MSIYQFGNQQDEADYEIAMTETARRRARAILDRDEQCKGFYLSPELDFNKWLTNRSARPDQRS